MAGLLFAADREPIASSVVVIAMCGLRHVDRDCICSESLWFPCFALILPYSLSCSVVSLANVKSFFS